MLQVFHLELAKVDLNIAYVAMAIHACAQEHVSSVSSIFRRMLQVFYLDVHMLQMAMLQVYVLNVSSISGICCNGFI
jgi:hypothetical protein